MQQKKHILLLGSGLMAESVASHLLKRPQNFISIASDIEQQAKKLSQKLGADRSDYSQVDVTNPASLTPLIKKSDIVISYVPAFLHMHIAKICLQQNKNLITASYVSPQMKALNQQVQKKGLLFLNQLGLDPGIDHLATMKIVHEVEQEGGKIVEYESWCGGLPSPTDCNNPLGYKFTWSPIGAFRAFNNNAVYLQNDQEKKVDAKDLLYFGKKVKLNQALQLEGYPNRNSIPYKELYGLKDSHKVLRGTLRYKGFCTIINSLKEIGITAQNPVLGQTWPEHITALLKDQQGNSLQQKIYNRCVKKVSHYDHFSEEEKKLKHKQLLGALKYFDFLNPASKMNDVSKNSLENLVKLLDPKLSLKEGETDLIAMQHLFTIQKGGKRYLKKSTMIQIGDKKGFSAMSLTVGTPTAIGAQLMLDGKISERGVIIPVFPDIYIPVLEKLEQEGIKLVDTEEQI